MKSQDAANKDLNQVVQCKPIFKTSSSLCRTDLFVQVYLLCVLACGQPGLHDSQCGVGVY